MNDQKKGDDPTDVDISEIQNADETGPGVDLGTQDISLDAVLEKEATSPEAEALKKRRKKFYRYSGIVGSILLIMLIIYGCQPIKASMAFGICSTFLELNTPYPQTLQYSELEGSQTAVRIYFTHIDPFGVYRQEMIECTFAADQTMGMRLTEVKRNRRQVDQDVVRKFNIVLPTIMSSDPYLVPPPHWKNPLVTE